MSATIIVGRRRSGKSFIGAAVAGAICFDPTRDLYFNDYSVRDRAELDAMLRRIDGARFDANVIVELQSPIEVKSVYDAAVKKVGVANVHTIYLDPRYGDSRHFLDVPLFVEPVVPNA